MTILETQSDMRMEDKLYPICELLKESNKKLEEAMFKLKEVKESESDSDTRMWRAEGDYRGMGNYRSMSGGNYRMEEYPEDRRYRDDFRYRR